MKRNFYKNIVIAIFLISMFAMQNATAQQFKNPKKMQCENREARMEKIKAQKIAYLTQKLELTPDESKAFWPLYNQMDKERFDLRHKNLNNDTKRLNINDLSENEASVLIDEQLNEAQQLLDLRKTYSVKFKQVLPAKKVLLLFRSEKTFQQDLMDKMYKCQKENKK
mgnify:FL=1